MTEAKQARCLCGNVTLNVGSLARVFTACHCDMCRKWGGIWVAVECNDVTVHAPDGVKIYDSSEWAERGFCAVCGTHLYYKGKGRDAYFVAIGLFPETEAFEFTRQIFIDKKPDYYCFANSTTELTEREVFEQFSADSN
ncbi:MAG: GFA family protein [Gammaproteobacteria bacterium]